MLVKVRTWLANPFHIVNKKRIGSKKWTLKFCGVKTSHESALSNSYKTRQEIVILWNMYSWTSLYSTHIHTHTWLRYFAWFRNCTSEVSTGPFTASKDFYRIFLVGSRISIISSSYKSLFPLSLYSRSCFCIRTSCFLSNSSYNLTVLF
jgi:hypothetical protein